MAQADGSNRIYHAFGVVIESDFALPELRPAPKGATPHIRIEDRSIGREIPDEGGPVTMDYGDPGGVVMIWPGVAGFRFVDRETIHASRHPDAPPAYIAFPILGPIMAWILQWRGLFVLHASAIDIGGRTLALLGDKMAGKSTTAAAFVSAGYPLITDDLLAVEFASDGSVRCHPAFPQLKLADDAAAAIEVAGAEALPLVFAGFEKRQHRLSAMRSEPASIDCLAQLVRGGDQPHFEAFDLGQAIQAISRYSYLPRFADAPWSDADRAGHFRNCTRLASAAETGRLTVPHDLARLPETVDLMANRLAKLEP